MPSDNMALITEELPRRDLSSTCHQSEARDSWRKARGNEPKTGLNRRSPPALGLGDLLPAGALWRKIRLLYSVRFV